MTPLDDDLLAALRAARPDPGYQPSATSPEAAAMLSRIVRARHGVPEGNLPTRRRRRAPIIILATATAALAAVVVTLLPGNTARISPAAVRLLAKFSAAAAAQPAQPVRDSQFWYIKSWVSY